MLITPFYRPDHGKNLQPAIQAAVDYAAANGKPKVANDLGAIQVELWCPVRTSPFSPGPQESWQRTPDGRPLVVRHDVHLDFAGATFNLKGPGGGARQQPVSGYDKPWLGGWLYVYAATDLDRVTVENVTVDGGVFDSYETSDASNLSDKGLMIYHSQMNELNMRNVEMRNFGGEIYYVAGQVGPEFQYVENCHFHGSPQCAWDPAGVGKVKAVNVKAGRAYQAAEVLGGKGHIYEHCHFYDSGEGGSVFYGGPSPNVTTTHPWWYPYWDGVSEKPSIDFLNTKFERVAYLRLSSWARGNVEMTDGPVWLDSKIGDVRENNLRIKHWTDRANNGYALMMGGPPDLTTQVYGAREGIYIKPPSQLNVQIECARTSKAIAAGHRAQCGFMFTGGVVDASTITINVAGEMTKPWGSPPGVPPSPAVPKVTSTGFQAV